MRLSDLNFRHLLYFHAVVREGSVTAAAAALRVSQPTVSAQLRQLELDLGVVLLERDGRGVKPTEAGRVVARYAEEIFELGRELIGSVAGGAPGDHNRLRVGVADVLPKLVVARLLEPALKLDGVHVECRVGHPEELVSELAVHHLDVVLADAPLGAGASVRAFNHVLGGSAVSFCAVPSLAATLRDGFPVSLDGAPMLLPTRNTVMRRSLDAYFDGLGVARARGDRGAAARGRRRGRTIRPASRRGRRRRRGAVLRALDRAAPAESRGGGHDDGSAGGARGCLTESPCLDYRPSVR